MILVAKDGEAWQVGANDLNVKKEDIFSIFHWTQTGRLIVLVMPPLWKVLLSITPALRFPERLKERLPTGCCEGYLG